MPSVKLQPPWAGQSSGPGPVGPAGFPAFSFLDIQVGIGCSWLVSGSCNHTRFQNRCCFKKMWRRIQDRWCSFCGPVSGSRLRSEGLCRMSSSGRFLGPFSFFIFHDEQCRLVRHLLETGCHHLLVSALFFGMRGWGLQSGWARASAPGIVCVCVCVHLCVCLCWEGAGLFSRGQPSLESLSPVSQQIQSEGRLVGGSGPTWSTTEL